MEVMASLRRECEQRSRCHSGSSSAEEVNLIRLATGLPGNYTGVSWIDALAVLADLNAGRRNDVRIARLLASRGREGHWFWRWKFRFADRHVKFDPAKYGWGWTEETTSWVVPTAFAVLALEQAICAGIVESNKAGERIRLGKAMLLDRMCAAGGWNSGNPQVYGVALKPHLDTTAIAALALQDHVDHPGVSSALDWMLERSVRCPSAYSVAWALLVTAVFRTQIRAAETALANLQVHLVNLMPIPTDEPATAAIALLALNAVSGDYPFVLSGGANGQT